jgi:hypothetical protein
VVPAQKVEQIAETAGTELACPFVAGQRPATGATRLEEVVDGQRGAIAEKGGDRHRV